MVVALLVIIGYLVGSIPSAYLSMRLFTGVDIRSRGTGTASVTAVLMHGGKRPAIVALAAELLKGGLCVLIAYILVGEPWATLVILVAAIYGCSWSVWLKGGGGQGQTIMATGVFFLSPLALVIIAGSYLVPLLVTRRHFLSNQLFHVAVPGALWYTGGSWEWPLAGSLFVLPFFIKQWLVGDDVLVAGGEKAGSSSAGA
ncbi:MAG: glycerol-3-phosphate acyltransferase [Dehalococcoidia bacterium]|nr:glycerol-3-phosphate acyltransferase [Dehalococcoidia bacterium]